MQAGYGVKVKNKVMEAGMRLEARVYNSSKNGLSS